MSCSSENLKPDWKAYVLGELKASDRQQAEAHASTCSDCREEVATLRLTLDTLSTLREEEVPRRIAFVSDKVFGPRWWQSFLRPSFAAGCVVAAAILVHGFARPAVPQATLEAAVEAAVTKAVTPAVSGAAVQAAIDSAVTKAVVRVENDSAQQIQNLLSDYSVSVKRNMVNYINTNEMRRQ